MLPDEDSGQAVTGFEALEDERDQESAVVDGVAVDDERAQEPPQTQPESPGLEALASAELVPAEPRDRHEGMIAMDAHDAARFVDRLTAQAQEANLGKRWIYQLPYGGGDGLTVDAVQDITQQMNWSGRCRITLLPETLKVEVVEADEGRGPEPFWVATIFAEDEMTGQRHGGTSMEPQMMQLKPETAAAKRNKGAQIPEDNRVFDRFARTKAENKAARNAEEKHIPEVVKLTLIAMAKNKPSMIEKIQTPTEAKAADWPAPLTTPEAEALNTECEDIYTAIRGLGGGRGALEMPPGLFGSYRIQSAHDLSKLEGLKAWLLQERDRIAAKFEAS